MERRLEGSELLPNSETHLLSTENLSTSSIRLKHLRTFEFWCLNLLYSNFPVSGAAKESEEKIPEAERFNKRQPSSGEFEEKTKC